MAIEPNSSNSNSGDMVQSVSTLFSILELLKENDGMGTTGLAKEMDMSKGAVHRYLQTLVNEGYAVNKGGTYEMGLRFLDFGAYVQTEYPFNQFIRPKVRQLAEQTGERAQYIVEEHGRGIYLHRDQGENAVQTNARVGKVVYLHTTAAGKAILCQLSRSRVDEIIDEHGLVEQTSRTITDRDALHEELADIREQGYALNKEEHAPGLHAIGVPITNQDGNIFGGLSVSGPTNRIRDQIRDESIQRKLLGIQNEIELNLNYY